MVANTYKLLDRLTSQIITDLFWKECTHFSGLVKSSFHIITLFKFAINSRCDRAKDNISGCKTAAKGDETQARS